MRNFVRASLSLVAVAFATGCTHGAEPGGPREPGTTDEAAVQRMAQNLGVEVTYGLLVDRGTQYIKPSVKVTNLGQESISAEAPPAHWWFKAYANPERQGTPIWNLEDHFSLPQEYAVVVDIPPGESWIDPGPQLGTVADILGGNPTGRYYFTVQLELSRPRGRTPEFPAGELDLAGPALVR